MNAGSDTFENSVSLLVAVVWANTMAEYKTAVMIKVIFSFLYL
jgi:hypothetical protein